MQKENLFFSFISECIVSSAKPKLLKNVKGPSNYYIKLYICTRKGKIRKVKDYEEDFNHYYSSYDADGC